MKYVLAAFGVILAAILAIVLITRKPSTPTPTTTNGTNKPMDLTAQNGDGTAMEYVTFGQLVGEERRRAIRITVSQDERKVEVLAGYDSDVTSSQIFPNTPSAYNNFLSGIERAGFISSRKTNIVDEQGVCPTGSRFNYNVLDYGEEVVHLWGSSCNKGHGTFAGNAALIARLFQEQIPGYSNIATAVRQQTRDQSQ